MIARFLQLYKNVIGIVLIAVTLATAIRLLAVSAPLGIAWSNLVFTGADLFVDKKRAISKRFAGVKTTYSVSQNYIIFSQTVNENYVMFTIKSRTLLLLFRRNERVIPPFR